MADIGELKAYTEPRPGVKRPLRVIAAAGEIPVYLVDGDGNIINEDNPLFIQSESLNNMPSLIDERSNTYQLLGNMIKELKIMNLHLSKITGYEIDRMEIEDWKS